MHSIVEQDIIALAEFIDSTITTTNVFSQESVLLAIQQTLLSLLHTWNAFTLQSFLEQESQFLSRVNYSAVGLSSNDLLLINNRLASLNTLINTVNPYTVWPSFDANKLKQGQPAIPFYDIIKYFVEFDVEPSPSNLTAINLESVAEEEANAWNQVLNYLNTNISSYQVSAYNSVDRMTQSSYDIADLISNLNLNSNARLQQVWNSIIALPTLLRVGALLVSDPSRTICQTISVIRTLLLLLLWQTNALLANINRSEITNVPILGTLKAGESLMDFAARTLGDYTKWEDIASMNDLLPPYVSNTPRPNTAMPGQNLYLTSPPTDIDTSPDLDQDIPAASYVDFILGSDIDFGQPGGDISFAQRNIGVYDLKTTAGYGNLIYALTRRVLTPLNSLIYHPTFGSKLPSEVGNINTTNEALLLTAYLKSALLADPRVKAVGNLVATPIEADAILLTNTVFPIGNLTTAVRIGLTLINNLPKLNNT